MTQDELAKMAHGMTITDAKIQGVCVACKLPTGSFSSLLGAADYNLRGLCEPCVRDAHRREEVGAG